MLLCHHLAYAASFPAPEVSFVFIFFGAINLPPFVNSLHPKSERATRVTGRANERRSLFRLLLSIKMKAFTLT